MSESGWSTWARESGSGEWTNPEYPGWSTVDVYDEPPGHEVRRLGQPIGVRFRFFTDAVVYIERESASEKYREIPEGESGQPYVPGQPWKMTWRYWDEQLGVPEEGE